MSNRKICVVITARPSYSRVRSALYAIRDCAGLELDIILAGSALIKKYGDMEAVLQEDGFTVSEKIYNLLDGESPVIMAKTTGLAIMELSTAFQNLKPDIAVTIADRYETLATSIAAAYQNIPLAHIQGGEITGSIDEKVRHANTKLADLHLVSCEGARERVIKMGEDGNTVINTGCPSIDIAKDVLHQKSLSFDPVAKYGGVGEADAWKNGYLVVMQHSVTSEYENAVFQVQETLEAIVSLNKPAFWFWPNADSGSEGILKSIRKYREQGRLKNLHFFKNMNPEDFLSLLKHSLCLVGNSSVGIRECAFLGVPAVNIGSRQHMRDRAENVIDCAYDRRQIEQACITQIEHGHYGSDHIYGDGNSGAKIAEALKTCELRTQKTLSYRS